MNKLTTIFPVVLASCIFTASPAQESVKDLEALVQRSPRDVATLMKLGTQYHLQGVAGDEKAVEKGFACFDTVLVIEPSNALAWAYRGSLWTLRGRDASDPMTKMGDVDKGTDEMDKAVDLAPDNITVRITRGVNSLHLPPMFKRLGTALKDFTYLLGHPGFSKFDTNLQSNIYCWAGIAYKQDNQREKAKELLQKAISVAPQSDSARNAEQELKGLS
jgi:tetratricopeptide (TPR) repeat protein